MEKTIQNANSKVPPSEGFREAYILHLADSSLILSHRNSEWCGHGPVLEQDIAITNISLDLLGLARNYYQYAAELIGDTDENKLAYLRTEREFKNLLLVEQPNIDWAQTILRQYLFSQFQFFLQEQLQHNDDKKLAAIAEKSQKETRYHIRWSGEWVIRLGNGTEESHDRMINAINNLWGYTGEMFIPVEYEKEAGIDYALIKNQWEEKINEVFSEATLSTVDSTKKTFMHTGGKTGTHTENLGFILTDLQYLQRTYPGVEW